MLRVRTNSLSCNSGHVGQLTSASWDPRDNNKFLTSSMDSTLRIWDVNDRFKSLKTIVLKSKERGGRTKITQCTYSPDGKTIAATAIDGTINLWSTSSNFARPNSTAENAHTKGTETSGITYSLDGRTIVTRGGDDTVKGSSLLLRSSGSLYADLYLQYGTHELSRSLSPLHQI